MGQGMAVTLGGKTFSSKKSARDHFMDQREKVQAGVPVIEGELFVQLSDLYARYCEAKPSWKREGLVVQSFFVDYEPRETSAGWKQHLCYWVRFSSRQAISFSVREAIDTILKFEADSL